MTLDEVIEHANRVADSYKDTAPACKSAHEYRQLADWLTELKVLRTENAELREQIERLQPKDCEGNALDIADTVSMLRSEYDGDHEWDDVVVELVLTKWGGDRWIVRGSKGEAWACDCAKTGYDEDAYEGSDDVEPIDNPTLVEAENAKLRELVKRMHGHIKDNCDICDGWYCSNFDEDNECCVYDTLVRGLGIEVDG